MDYKFFLILSLFIFLAEVTYVCAIDAKEAGSVIITCPLSGDPQYPKWTWTGLSNLTKRLTDGDKVKQEGFEWINNTNLYIKFVSLDDEGTYTCSDGNNTERVQLNVIYNAGTVVYWTSSNAFISGEGELKCEAHSKPDSIITWANLGEIQGRYTTSQTKCKMQPLVNESVSRNVCSTVLTITPIKKEDNGKSIRCNFNYGGKSSSMDHEITFDFPPTMVNITGKNRPIKLNETAKTSTLKLKCSTDSSNPVSELVWRKGNNPDILKNEVIFNINPMMTMDAKYNGKNISQEIDVIVDSSMNEQTIYCCALQKRLPFDSDWCGSYTLTVSSTVRIPTSMSLLAASLAIATAFKYLLTCL